MFLFTAILNNFLWYSMALGPRFLRCLMFILSGPVELLFLLFLMASFIIFVVMMNSVPFSLAIARSIFLLFRFVECLVIFMNWLLKFLAFSLLLMAILVLKLIARFG